MSQPRRLIVCGCGWWVKRTSGCGEAASSSPTSIWQSGDLRSGSRNQGWGETTGRGWGFQAKGDGRGGEYWSTYYPQPTVIPSRAIALHLDTTAHSAFDFGRPGRPEIECWAMPDRLEFWAADAGLVSALSARFGRSSGLPPWLDRGSIIGLKDGANSFARLKRIEAAGIPVAGRWCEDWAGVRDTRTGGHVVRPSASCARTRSIWGSVAGWPISASFSQRMRASIRAIRC